MQPLQPAPVQSCDRSAKRGWAVRSLKAHAEPSQGCYGKHLFCNCIMKQNANMMQVGVCSEMECLNTD